MFLKSLAAAIAAVTFAAACGPQARSEITLVEGDAFVGPADAKVTVIEYGSPTCPACKAWHDEFWAQMKSTYTDTGKVKFVFRELPVHGAIDVAIFSIARCAGPEDYFPVLDEAFAKQDEIVRAMQSVDGPQQQLVALGQKFRLSAEQVEACIRDPKNIDRIYEVDAVAKARGVNSTPTFFINDRELHDYRFSEMAAQIDALLAADAAPAAAPAETSPTGAAPAQPPSQ